MSLSTTVTSANQSVNTTPVSQSGVVSNVVTIVNPSVTSSQNISQQMNSNTDQIIMDMLDDLITKRQNWENTELARSNERLYDILTECYALFQSINGSSDNATIAKRSFDRIAKQKEFDFVDNKHYTARVVSIVFNNKTELRRIARYAAALRVAADEFISVNNLKEFFYQSGGIDEVRKKVKSDKGAMARHTKGRAILYRSPITTIVDPMLGQEIPASNYGSPVILVAKYKENSQEFEIVGVTQNTAATKMVFSSFASLIDEHSDEYKKLKAELKDAELKAKTS